MIKKKDVFWILILVTLTSIIVVPFSRGLFETATASYPYIMGFIKTAILATMGEIMVHRIKTGYYFRVKGLVVKCFVWGLLGMIFVIIFKLFASGVTSAQLAGYLPSFGLSGFLASLLTAFLISVFMNLFFAPTFMILHRITDGYIELGEGNLKKIVHVKLDDVIQKIQWTHFFSFVVLKTIPFFWIPAHTITFLLPENYRVLMAAYLSIALGFILTIAKTSKIK
jgi:hypothetical protein